MWSLVNPAVTIAVFYVIFSLVLNPIPAFAIFLMCGVLVMEHVLVPASAAGSVVGNAPLVKKVWFPQGDPPASSHRAMVDFFLQALVLVAALAVFRWPIGWGTWLPSPSWCSSCSPWPCPCGWPRSMRYRVSTLLGIALMVWFWASPI